MKIITVEQKNVWERFITKNSPQSLFQSWDWGEVEKRVHASAKGEYFWRWGLVDKNQLVGIAQIQKISAKRGTFFHIRHGPIFSEYKKTYLSFLFDKLRSISRKNKCTFIRVSPLIDNTIVNQNKFRDLGFINSPLHSMDGESCWVLDLECDESEIMQSMRKTTRYLIRSALKSGVYIEKSRKKEDLYQFMTLYNETAKRQGFVKHKGISEEFMEFQKTDNILLFKGFFAKKLLSMALIIFYNHQAIYHHSASKEQKIPVNYLLQWEVIKEAKKRGKKIYNFWGVAPDNNDRHPWKNLSLFKKGFGGRAVNYMHAKDLPFSPLYCTTYCLEWIRKVWKGY